MQSQRDKDRVELVNEQRKREDASPRLSDEISTLRTLRMKFEDKRNEGQMCALSYSKPIVVQSAPASFEIRCMEPRCDGRHDLTVEMLRSLRRGLTLFGGQSACNGMTGEIACDRTLVYHCEATYSAGLP